MDAFLHFIESEVPFVLKADNGKFLKFVAGQVKAVGDAIEPDCQLYAEKGTEQGTMLLLHNGMVLHRYPGRPASMLVDRSDADRTGVIRPSILDDGSVILQADDSTFYARGSDDNFAAIESCIQSNCKFRVEDGAVVAVDEGAAACKCDDELGIAAEECAPKVEVENSVQRNSQAAEFIGSGYDVFANYANPANLKKRIFDINHAEEYSRYIQQVKADTYILEGSSRSDYEKKLAVRVAANAEYPMFPASVEAGFQLEGSDRHFKETRFTSVNLDKKLEIIRLNNKEEEYMTEEARRDLATADPHDVIKEYGGYVVTGVVIGGRWSINVMSNSLHQASNLGLRAKLRAAARSYVFGEFTADFESNITAESAYLEYHVKVVGGNINHASPDKVSEWKESVTVETAQVTDFTETDGLVPIWDFVNDDGRKRELKKAFRQHAERKMQPFQCDDELPSVLEAKYTIQPIPFYSDEGSRAKKNLALYSMPDGDGWKYVGHSGNDHAVLALRERQDGYGALKLVEPTQWYQVWSDKGSFNTKDYSIWMPKAPPGYYALGVFCRFGVGGLMCCADHKEPSEEAAKNIVVVHESFVEQCDIERDEDWTSEGMGAKYTITLGKLKHHALWPIESTNPHVPIANVDENKWYTLKELPQENSHKEHTTATGLH